MKVAPADLDRLRAGEHDEPHGLLGAHPTASGALVRAWHPDAAGCELLVGGRALAMAALAPGLFAVDAPGLRPPFRYRLRWRFAGGAIHEGEDPYRFLPTLGELDLHLFGEGTHRRLWRCLGAHPRQLDGIDGTAFAVWAPNALRVSLVGDFCAWDGRRLPMRRLGSSGIYELFVPGVAPGALYKYEILTRERRLRLKADPYAQAAELPPGSASRVAGSSYEWGDAAWLAARRGRDWAREPIAIYEVHLGSWARVPEEGNRPLTYREIAPRLAAHARELGFTHLELLPVAEHPFAGSWGYQVSGYFAPTARHGTPDDFRYLVDHCHQAGLGVILDWVPAHFVSDDFALRRFDGTALYEHEDPRLAVHPDWGTLIFNYGRREVQSFLIANALYWLDELHVDGLRVDAVASMLYLDYSRKEGQWLPNEYGGRENLGAIDFLRACNQAVREEQPGCLMIAEESTAWPGVTRAVDQGGLGFTLKWNMGWMHDTLAYFREDPIHRPYHHDKLTFAMLYEHSERFVNPLSHDEVVHGKGSLYGKLPGDPWQKLANLRALYAYQYMRPGKKLLFMGSELAPLGEWNHDASLDWHLGAEPARAGLAAFLGELGRLYRERPCLWRSDPEFESFHWIDCNDKAGSVVSWVRRSGDDLLLVVLNLTPVPRDDYRIGAPRPGRWRERLNSDAAAWGGSGYPTPRELAAEPIAQHGMPDSLRLSLPPLAALILEPQ